MDTSQKAEKFPALELTVVSAVILLFGLLTYGAGMNTIARQWFINLSWTFASFFAGWRCLLASRKQAGATRRAWQFFAAGCFSWFLGMVIWDYLELLRKQSTPFPALSDVGFMFFAPFFMAGLVLLKQQGKSVSFTLIQLSKLGVIIASLIFIHFYNLITPILSSRESTLYVAAALAYPVLYMSALMYGVLSLKDFRLDISPAPYLLILAGLAVHAFTDSLYAFSLLGKSYRVGHYLDIYWMIGFGLVYAAAVMSNAAGEKKHQRDKDKIETGSVVETLDSFLAPISLLILAVVVVLFTEQLHVENLQFLAPVFAALLFFIAVQQVMVDHWQRDLYRNLLVSDQRYQDMTSTMPGIVYQFRISRDGGITFPYVSPSVEKMLGLSPESVMRDYNEVFSRIYPDDAGDFHRSIQDSHAQLIPWEWEGRINRDSVPVWIRCRSLPRKQDDGSVLWNGIVVDITEQKKAEQVLKRSQEELEQRVKLRTKDLEQEIVERKRIERELRESEDRLKEAQHLGQIGHWTWDVSSGKIFWSDEIFRIFGQEPGSFQPTYDAFVQSVHPGDLEHVLASEKNAFDKGTKHSIDHRILLPDGSIRWVHEEATAIKDEQGRPVSLMGTVQDVSQRKLAEIALQEAKDEAEEANRAKSEFMSRMSHELRTPMNAILGFGQLLEMDPAISDEQRSGIEEILSAGRHLLELINELLDLSRIEAGKLELNPEDVPLCDVINECVRLVLPMANKHAIRISADFNGCTTLLVKADRLRLKQVILNLLSNAVKYNRDHGSVEVSCLVLDEQYCQVSVKDTGIGIPEDRMGDLFKSFRRLGVESRAIEGAGIGLFIVRQLVEKMGGVISVDSTPGVGSTFTVRLPVSNQQGNILPNEQVNIQKPGSETTATAAGYCKIYYVEDNPANKKLVEKILAKNTRVELHTSIDAETALQEIPRIQPDVILMDITLPGMSGYEAALLLKSNPLTRGIPVIALSAHARQEDINKGLEIGLDGYLTKPIDLQEFYNTLGAVLGKDIREVH